MTPKPLGTSVPSLPPVLSSSTLPCHSPVQPGLPCQHQWRDVSLCCSSKVRALKSCPNCLATVFSSRDPPRLHHLCPRHSAASHGQQTPEDCASTWFINTGINFVSVCVNLYEIRRKLAPVSQASGFAPSFAGPDVLPFSYEITRHHTEFLALLLERLCCPSFHATFISNLLTTFLRFIPWRVHSTHGTQPSRCMRKSATIYSHPKRIVLHPLHTLIQPHAQMSTQCPSEPPSTASFGGNDAYACRLLRQ